MRKLVPKTKAYVASLVNKWRWTERLHYYDATGRLLKSSYSAYYAGDTPTVSSLEHTYGGARHLQNYDNVSTYGVVWHWAGAQHEHQAPLRSPNADTASQKGYNTAVSMGNASDPRRRSWQNPTTEGDKRLLFGQGRPMAKDSSGSGANWYAGTLSQPQSLNQGNVNSRLFFEGTVTATDMSRATDAREKGRIGIFGTAESYGGSYPRVASEAIGRDLNPLGRGGGQALVAGMLNLGAIMPTLPSAVLRGGRKGNSVNNSCAWGACGASSSSNSTGEQNTIFRNPFQGAGRSECGPIPPEQVTDRGVRRTYYSPPRVGDFYSTEVQSEGVGLADPRRHAGNGTGEKPSEGASTEYVDCLAKANADLRARSSAQHEAYRIASDTYNSNWRRINKEYREAISRLMNAVAVGSMPSALVPWQYNPQNPDPEYHWFYYTWCKGFLGQDDFATEYRYLAEWYARMMAWRHCKNWNDFASTFNDLVSAGCESFNQWARDVNRCIDEQQDRQSGSPTLPSYIWFKDCSKECLFQFSMVDCGEKPKRIDNFSLKCHMLTDLIPSVGGLGGGKSGGGGGSIPPVAP